jgi:flagellar hook-length control protein FliK
MPTELAIQTPAPTTVAPSAPASAPTAAPANCATDAKSRATDFVSALAEALTAEASIATSAAPLTKPVTLKDEDPNVGDLVDVSALFVDPQALLLSMDQAQRAAPAPQIQSDVGTRAVGTQADRTILAALTSASNAASAVSTDDQGISSAAVLLDATNASLDSKSDGKSATKSDPDNSAANVFATNALRQDRIAEMNDRPVIRAHVGSGTWTEELAGKLTVMVGRGMQSASLQLSPEHLGPLEIRISVQNEQASVWFGAAHAETRAALEQSLPRLRELLAGQGLNLSDAGVFRETPRERAKQYSTSQIAGGDAERDVTIAAIGLRGILDAYA